MDAPAQTDPAPSDAAPPAAPARPARRPGFGEMAPAFSVLSEVNPNFQSRSLGGVWVVLMFFGTLGHEASRKAYEQLVARRGLFDDQRAQFFGVSYDRADNAERGIHNSLPGLRYFWDFDRKVSRLYGAALEGGYAPMTFLLDPNMRIAQVETISRTGAILDRLEAELSGPAYDALAPILTLPRILEPDFCQSLIADYHAQGGGKASGFMRAVEGKTVPMLNDTIKKRKDVDISDPALKSGLRERLTNRLIPMIKEAFGWEATRIERYIVACYAAEDRGFFRQHRDNTTPGTAHRRFAVTINLNDDFEGGDLRFPEFGPRTYRPPLGGATVFGCSLLHEATPVTRGIRYATLPFLYDDAGAALRAANKHTLVTPGADLESAPKG